MTEVEISSLMANDSLVACAEAYIGGICCSGFGGVVPGVIFEGEFT